MTRRARSGAAADRVRRALLGAAVAAALVGVVLAVSGGLAGSLAGIRVSARSPGPATAAALVLLAAWVVTARRAGAARDDLQALTGWLERRDRRLVWALALATGALAWAFATVSAAGADASGYLSQAAMWARLDWRIVDSLASSEGWPLPPESTAPLGWRPALERGWQVPTYAPGLPLLMAVPYAIAGNAGASAVVTACAVVAVVAAGGLARRVAGGLAGLVAAALVASSPTFLYHALQPMSDVPVAAAWALCWWALAAERPLGAGAAAAMAVLIRPNLAPLAAVPAIWLLAGRHHVAPIRAAVRFAVPVALSGALVATLQTLWYGSPLTSGYGSAGELFAITNVGPNLILYAGWIWEAERTFVVVNVLLAVWLAVRTPRLRSTTETRDAGLTRLAALVIFAGGVVASYLIYARFERWTYVRFLLPALMAGAALAGAGAGRVIGRAPRWAQGLIAAVAIVGLMAAGTMRARALGVFEVAELASRAPEAGAALRAVLPPNAVLIAGEQSGSMRHETGRPVVRWETLDAASLGRAIDASRARGLEAWWVLDQWEEALVRSRFGSRPEGALDGPPQVEGGRVMRTRAWRIRD